MRERRVRERRSVGKEKRTSSHENGYKRSELKCDPQERQIREREKKLTDIINCRHWEKHSGLAGQARTDN